MLTLRSRTPCMVAANPLASAGSTVSVNGVNARPSNRAALLTSSV